jgi:beta-catenin-like protein 1
MKILLEELEKKAGNTTVVELSAKGIRYVHLTFFENMMKYLCTQHSILIEQFILYRRAAAKLLESMYKKNALKREEFSDQPDQYMDSELALYEQLTGLQAIGADSKLYSNVENTNLMSTLTQLLAHENSDICATVVSIFVEWIDPSLIEDDPDVLPVLKRFGKTILDGWENIISNLFRFQIDDDDAQQTEETNLKGVDNTLSLMENLLELDTLCAPDGMLGDETTSVAAYMVKESMIVSWLFLQLESPDSELEKKSRSMELLAFVSQNVDVFEQIPNWSSLPYPVDPHRPKEGEPVQKKTKVSEINGIEILIQNIAKFRKNQPDNDTETEILENACIAMSSCISFSVDNMSAFIDAQGMTPSSEG